LYVLPILAAVFVFGEAISTIKAIGIVVGFAAIICSIPWHKESSSRRKSKPWFFLLAVFLGFGVIDVLFKQIAAFKAVPYTTSLFIVYILAFLFSIVGFLIKISRKMTRFSLPHVLIGWVLGIVNFGNILFYLKAHQALSSQPSTVFSAMNIGVIILGALVGLFVFKEKLTTLNKIGLGLALIAIIIITYSTY
jgi:drug/metabolite transporter (DMT)-like permease